jgi:hypothetical protein
MSAFEISWIWRSRLPAKCKPDENYPYGKATDMSAPGKPFCEVEFKYPAPGVGTWIARCKTCDFTMAVTAAGRADDPTKVRWACERKESA